MVAKKSGDASARQEVLQAVRSSSGCQKSVGLSEVRRAVRSPSGCQKSVGLSEVRRAVRSPSGCQKSVGLSKVLPAVRRSTPFGLSGIPNPYGSGNRKSVPYGGICTRFARIFASACFQVIWRATVRRGRARRAIGRYRGASLHMVAAAPNANRPAGLLAVLQFCSSQS
jgi:hypothetical protein